MVATLHRNFENPGICQFRHEKPGNTWNYEQKTWNFEHF